MFRETLIESVTAGKSEFRAAIPLAYLCEVALLGALMLVPLLRTEALPKLRRLTDVPPSPAPRGVPRPASAARPAHRPAARQAFEAPPVIPPNVALSPEQPAPPQDRALAGTTTPLPAGAIGVPDGVSNSIFTSSMAPPPLPLRLGEPAHPRIKIGGIVQAAKLVYQPKPEYPLLAKMARVQGTVRLAAIINKDGTIQDLKVLSGHPLLLKAALEAVARWRYQPTLLDGNPVEVATEIDVNFVFFD